MNKSERGFKGLVHEMCKMILNLLSSLNINKMKSDICQAVNFFIFYLLRFIYFLHFQTHVTANTSDIWILFHVFVHIHECMTFRSKSNIKKNGEFRSKFFTKSIEKPIMRRKFTCIFVFNTKEKIHNGGRSCVYIFVLF